MSQATTLYDKIWNSHIVEEQDDGTCLIYIDRQLLHEVTSPQAFDGLRQAKRIIRHKEKNLAVADHNTPTKNIDGIIENDASRISLETLAKNTKEFELEYYPLGTSYNGVCHVIAPELGFTLPGVTFVCGDSHTATHGAFGAVAFGIGTSEIEHVFATQTLRQRKAKNMRITINGTCNPCVTPKDIILHIIGKIGTAGGTGYAIEYTGDVFKNMSMEGRMTVCNMTIEAGARVGIVAPDDKTFAYIKDNPKAPKGELWDKAVSYWKTLKSDDDAVFDEELLIDAKEIVPNVTWGTSPEDTVAVTGVVPEPKNETKKRALDYMDLKPGTPMTSIKIDRVFIGACTNGRLEDIAAAAQILKGKKVAPHVKAIVVPGSALVKKISEEKGYDIIFKDAGFEWRHPGCSMCLAMNEDKAAAGERVASTSNRNFEGRQGRGSRTHLMSPIMAAAAAIKGYITDVREIVD
ncbi:MAG: 3-isopropylmalate dehydratase large subunit [Alphaproteobacteria bacterium]